MNVKHKGMSRKQSYFVLVAYYIMWSPYKNKSAYKKFTIVNILIFLMLNDNLVTEKEIMVLYLLFTDIAINEKYSNEMSKAAFLKFIELPVRIWLFNFHAINKILKQILMASLNREWLEWERSSTLDTKTTNSLTLKNL